MSNNLQIWHEKVIKSRFITSCFRTYLQRTDKLYGRLATIGAALSCYLKLVKERDALVSNDLQVLIYEDRVKDEHLAYERERQRDRVNLHNFTRQGVTRDEIQGPVA